MCVVFALSREGGTPPLHCGNDLLFACLHVRRLLPSPTPHTPHPVVPLPLTPLPIHNLYTMPTSRNRKTGTTPPRKDPIPQREVSGDGCHEMTPAIKNARRNCVGHLHTYHGGAHGAEKGSQRERCCTQQRRRSPHCTCTHGPPLGAWGCLGGEFFVCGEPHVRKSVGSCVGTGVPGTLCDTSLCSLGGSWCRHGDMNACDTMKGADAVGVGGLRCVWKGV